MSDFFSKLSAMTTKPSAASLPEFVFLYSRPGGGKGLVYGTPVYTPTGPVPVESLAVGDMVIGSDGKPVRVYGLWDRGVLPVFRVEFSDGAEVTVDGDHLWTVSTSKGTQVTIDTHEIIRRFDSARPKYLTVPTVAPVEFTGSDLPIPPYMLGALIADGALGQMSVQWTKNDQSVVDEFNRSASLAGWQAVERTYESSTARQWKIVHPDDKQMHSTIKAAVVGLGLNVGSRDKFIPEQYLHASVEDRWALVNGLFDGDGRVRENRNMAQYHTVSERLADDVVQLLWSLGVSANKLANRRNDGTWSVSVLSDHEVFKASKYVGTMDNSKRVRPGRRIVSVTPAGHAEVRCIAVEVDDQLYVTKDYIVTHNTHLAASISEVDSVKKVLIIDTEGSTIGTLANFDDTKIDIVRVDEFGKFQAILNGLLEAGDENPYDAVIIDTFDVAQDWAIKEFDNLAPLSKSGEKDGFAKWGMVKEWTLDLGRRLRNAPFKVVVVFHEAEDKKPDGSVKKNLALSGSAKDVFPGLPDMVVWLERKIVDGEPKTLAHFESDDNKVTKNRFGLPPVVEDVTFPKIFKFIESKNNTKEN